MVGMRSRRGRAVSGATTITTFHTFQTAISTSRQSENQISPCVVLTLIRADVLQVTEQSVFVAGDVAVKILKVNDPTPEQFQAFRNEVAVLR